MSFKRKASLFTTALLVVSGLTSAGTKTELFDGDLTAVSSDPSILTVEPTDDPFRFKVTRTGLGLATVTVVGDADPGEGIRQITKVFPFEFWDGDEEPVDIAGDLENLPT